MRSSRNVAGLVDQAVSAGTSMATGLLVLPFRTPHDAGPVVFAISLGPFAMGIARALVGDVLLTYSARYEPAERNRQAAAAAQTAALLGLVSAVVAGVAWAVGPRYLAELIWLAPGLPFVLVHDAGRYVFLAARQPERTLISDLTFVAAQVAVLAPLLAAGYRDGAVFLLAWGVGGLAGAASFLFRARISPVALFRGDPRQWIGQTRHLSGWLTITALLGQAQVQVVFTLITNLLSQAALSIFRLAQYGLLMPAQNLQMAVSSLLVPRMSPLAQAGDKAGITKLVRQSLLATALAGVLPLAVSPLAGPVIRWALPAYTEAAAIAVPVALQSLVFLLQVPFTAALRGMQRVRSLFVQYVVFSVGSVAGLVVGAREWGLRGAAWGLTFGAGLGLVVMVLAYQRAHDSLRAPVAAAHPEPAPVH